MAVDVGDLYRLAYRHTSPAGDLVSAGAANWVITLPDGTSTTIPATPVSPGVYQNDYLTIQDGRHLARWLGTGVNPGAYTEAFDVRPADPPYLVSLSEVKAHLNMTSTTHDEELRGFIEAATKAAEDHRQETIARRTVRHYRQVRNRTWIVLPRVPVISLTSVQAIDLSKTWTVNSLHIDSATGRVTALPGSPPFDGDLEFTYVAGYRSVPGAFVLAVKLIVQHLWETQRGPAGSSRFAGTIDDANLLRFRGIDIFIPPRAQELLGDRAPLVG